MFFYLTELWTDAVVVALTVYRSIAAFRATAVRNSTTRLWKVILKDGEDKLQMDVRSLTVQSLGLAYFVIIFSTNLVTVVMYAVSLLLPSTFVRSLINLLSSRPQLVFPPSLAEVPSTNNMP